MYIYYFDYYLLTIFCYCVQSYKKKGKKPNFLGIYSHFSMSSVT